MALGPRTITLLRLSTAIVTGNWSEIRRLRNAAVAPEPDRAWRECVLQCHLFAGFPRVVQALAILDEEGGLGALDSDELESPYPQPGATETHRGSELFERIYGSDAERVRAGLTSGHPEFDNWVLGHAYGRVLARPGLRTDVRELLASCALAALGQERQLASHARGALRCGAPLEDLLEAYSAVEDLIGTGPCERAKRSARRLRPDQA